MLYAFQHSIIIYIPLKLTQHVQNLIGEHTDTDCEQPDGGTFSPALSMSSLRCAFQDIAPKHTQLYLLQIVQNLELTMMLM